MKTIIIDDNLNAQEFLEELLKFHLPGLTLLGKACNVHEGKQLIASTAPDLVFLDVEMPQGTGFDLLQQIKEINFQVIFTTAYEKYALQAIRFSALDYLLKPIDATELSIALDKARENTQKELSQLKINTLLQNLRQQINTDQKLVLKDKYGMQITTVKDIIRLEADNNYTRFFIQNQSPILVSKSLKDYENILPKHYFFRCHKSHLVNLDYLLRYDKRDEEVLVLSDKSRVPVSRRKIDLLVDKIKSRGMV